MTLKRHQLASLTLVLVAALLSSAVAVSAGQQARSVRIKAQVGGGERAVAYGRSRLLLVPQGGNGITRVKLDGSVDRSFGANGTVAIASEDAVVTADGKIFVATTSCPRCGAGPKSEARVTRLLPSGRLDHSFGGDGSVDVPFGRRYNYAEAVALTADGDILLGGIRVDRPSNLGVADFSLAVARIRADGSLDRSFGGDGVSVLPGGGEIGALDIAATPTGGVVVDGGDAFYGSFLWRLHRDGSTDHGFGRSGIVEIRRPGAKDDEFGIYAPEIVVLPGGKLLAVAAGSGYPRNHVAALRLSPDGTLDRTYGDDGWAVAGAFRSRAKGLMPLSGGALAVAASFTGARGKSDFGLLVFDHDGDLDRRFGTNGRCRAGLSSGGYEAVDVALVDRHPVVIGHNEADSRLLSCPALRRR